MKEILDRRRRIEQERNLTSNSIELTEEIFSGNGSTQDQDIIGVSPAIRNRDSRAPPAV
ncbi:MAG: hypothetical protein WAK17_27045 [Candidatus Nitrosopolaris sp.]